jgi:aspartate aminotransferase
MTAPAIAPAPSSATVNSRLSAAARGLAGSHILRIAAEVRALAASGQPVANLTVGDFAPVEFPIPEQLRDGIIDALRAGESNYPPSSGLDELRTAIQQFYRRYFQTEYATDSILVTAGARPVIYAIYRALVDPGENVVFGTPSWNNDYYCQLVGANQVALPCDASTNFLPTAQMLRPHLRTARMLALNSPLNPTGTVFDPAVLAEICDAVLEENARRGPGERPLFMMFDQVYWMITVGGARHFDPLVLRPELEPYLLSVDGISKAFAATGLRVGWALGPADVVRSMSDILAHVGAWAPRPEQVATARFLGDAGAVDDYVERMCKSAASRLYALADGLKALADRGLPVEVVRPQGAIYVSVRFPLTGRRTPDGDPLETNDQIRRYMLNAAGLGAIPFQAFGMPGETGWFRLSIGVVSVAQIEELVPRIAGALERLR